MMEADAGQPLLYRAITNAGHRLCKGRSTSSGIHSDTAAFTDTVALFAGRDGPEPPGPWGILLREG